MQVLLALVIVALGGNESAPDQPNADPTSRTSEARRVEGNPPAGAERGPWISYEIQYVTTSDPDWRGKIDPMLKPLTRQGGSSVWSADDSTVRALLSLWSDHVTCNILQAPKAVAPEGDEVRIVNEQQIHYVAHLERIADGPVNKATKLAFKPEIDQIHDGVRIRLSSGRVEGQGLRALVAIDSDRVVSFRTSRYSEAVVPANPDHARPATLNATIQVPVIDSARVVGEWLIPRDGALIVSLGDSRSEGRLVRTVRPEELVVIRFRPVPGPASPTPIERTSATSTRGGGFVAGN